MATTAKKTTSASASKATTAKKTTSAATAKVSTESYAARFKREQAEKKAGGSDGGTDNG